MMEPSFLDALPVTLPTVLRGKMRYIVAKVWGPRPMGRVRGRAPLLQSGTAAAAYRYDIEHVQDTVGVRALFRKLARNQRRSTHKPFCGVLCPEGPGGALCRAGRSCHFIHVGVSGVARRHPWMRPPGMVTTPDPVWLAQVCRKGRC